MVDSYVTLYRRLLADGEIALRIRNKLRHLGNPIYRSAYTPRQAFGILWRLISKGILPGGPARLWHFLRSMPWFTPSRFPTVVSDWIVGLSMRHYAEQHLTPKPRKDSALKRRVEAVRRAIQGDLAQGNITVALQQSGTSHLAICLRRPPDRGFFKRVGLGLEQFLKHPRTTLTLQIETLTPLHLPQLEQLLRRLARYGDRVSIAMDERLRTIVPIDSSVFRLVLVGPESTFLRAHS